MRKSLLAGICVGAVVLPAVALGGPPPNPEYGGKIDKKPNRYIGFDISGQGNNRKLQEMFIVNVPFSGCDDPGDDGRESGSFDKKFAVDENGKFGDTKTDMFNARGVATGSPTPLREGRRQRGQRHAQGEDPRHELPFRQARVEGAKALATCASELDRPAA